MENGQQLLLAQLLRAGKREEAVPPCVLRALKARQGSVDAYCASVAAQVEVGKPRVHLGAKVLVNGVIDASARAQHGGERPNVERVAHHGPIELGAYENGRRRAPRLARKPPERIKVAGPKANRVQRRGQPRRRGLEPVALDDAPHESRHACLRFVQDGAEKPGIVSVRDGDGDGAAREALARRKANRGAPLTRGALALAKSHANGARPAHAAVLALNEGRLIGHA